MSIKLRFYHIFIDIIISERKKLPQTFIRLREFNIYQIIFYTIPFSIRIVISQFVSKRRVLSKDTNYFTLPLKYANKSHNKGKYAFVFLLHQSLFFSLLCISICFRMISTYISSLFCSSSLSAIFMAAKNLSFS